MANGMKSCVIIGNIPERTEIVGRKKDVDIAGSFISALVATRLGYATTIVSKISRTFDKKYLDLIKKNGIKLVSLPTWQDTKYTVEYCSEKNKAVVNRKEAVITSDAGMIFDIPSEVNGDIVIFASYFGDINLNVFKKVKNENNIVALNPQNFVKYKDPETGVLSYTPWLNKEEYLKYVDIFKINKGILPYITGSENINSISELTTKKYGIKTVVLAMSVDWGYIFYKKKFFRSVLYKNKVNTIMGSGEVYTTAFAIKFRETQDPRESMYFAVAAASLAFETKMTVNRGFTREAVEKRATTLKSIYLD